MDTFQPAENGGEEGKLYEHFLITTDKGQEPLRIDKFLLNRIENVSRNKIQLAAKAGTILANGKPVKPNYKVRPHDEITVLLPKPPEIHDLKPEPMTLDIVYEDDQLLVVNKPAGLVVHPGSGNYSGTLLNGLAYHFENLPQIEGFMRPGLVHRIDKQTSGLLVIAKTELTMTHLAKQFYDHTVKRRYVALVWGDPDQDEGTITGHIGRNLRYRKRMDVFPDGDHGKHAITHYKVLERLGYVCLVQCRLETGRTHQIRVHMQHIGHPVFNDETYGGDSIVKGTVYTKYKQFVENCFKLMPRQALHAKVLGFTHPVSGDWMELETPLPEDFQKTLEKWRNYTQNLIK